MTTNEALATLVHHAKRGAPEDEHGHVFRAVAVIAAAANMPVIAEGALRVCEQLEHADRAKSEAVDSEQLFFDLVRMRRTPPPPPPPPDGDGGAGS